MEWIRVLSLETHISLVANLYDLDILAMIFYVRSTVRNWNTLNNAGQPLSVDEYPIFRFIANKFVNEIHKLNSIIINKCHKYENRYILYTFFCFFFWLFSNILITTDCGKNVKNDNNNNSIVIKIKCF